MLEQLADKSEKEKNQKLEEFRAQIKEEFKSAEAFKRDNPDRKDMNAVLELSKAIEEEVEAVADLVKNGDDCPEDWSGLEEARDSLTKTLARIRHENWIALGPSRSRRVNQLFLYQKKSPGSKEAEALLGELKEVAQKLLAGDLTPGLYVGLERFADILEKPSKGFFRRVSDQVAKLEESMDVSLLDACLEAEDKCYVCFSVMEAGAERCMECGVEALSLTQPKSREGKDEAGRSQLLDSLNHSWKLYQHEEINQDNLLRILKNISEPIASAVEKLDSPSAALLDFSTRLELFTKLQDRKSLETHWPSLIASGRALIAERLSKLERD